MYHIETNIFQVGKEKKRDMSGQICFTVKTTDAKKTLVKSFWEM